MRPVERSHECGGHSNVRVAANTDAGRRCPAPEAGVGDLRVWRTGMVKLGTAVLAMGIAGYSAAQLQISIGVRETGFAGGTFTSIGANGGATGGIEFIRMDGQTLLLNNTWQLFTFNLGSDPVNAFAGASANGILEGSFGTLEMIRIKSTGAFNSPITMWIDDVTNTITPPGSGPIATNFGSFEGFADNTEVIFQEPSFSGSTSANVMAGSASRTDSTVPAHTGLVSDKVTFQYVDSAASRWVRLTTFNTPNLPNPQIRFDDNSQISFWVRAVPEPATMATLGLGVAALLRRRRKR